MVDGGIWELMVNKQLLMLNDMADECKASQSFHNQELWIVHDDSMRGGFCGKWSIAVSDA